MKICQKLNTVEEVKIKIKHFVDNLSILGININGVHSKMASLKSTLSDLKPLVVCIQETKMKNSGFLKIKGYTFMEKNKGVQRRRWRFH